MGESILLQFDFRPKGWSLFNGGAEDGEGGNNVSPIGKSAKLKVRPVQIREFLLKRVSTRLLKLSWAYVDKVMAAMRQLGGRATGGAEALVLFQQLMHGGKTAALQDL